MNFIDQLRYLINREAVLQYFFFARGTESFESPIKSKLHLRWALCIFFRTELQSLLFLEYVLVIGSWLLSKEIILLRFARHLLLFAISDNWMERRAEFARQSCQVAFESALFLLHQQLSLEFDIIQDSLLICISSSLLRCSKFSILISFSLSVFLSL